MDTPRDEEDIPGDDQAGDDEPSEEELEALMEAASEQAAEGVSLPAEDDADDEPPAAGDDPPAPDGEPEGEPAEEQAEEASEPTVPPSDDPPTDAGGDTGEEDVDADSAPAAETEDELPADASPDEADSETRAEADRAAAEERAEARAQASAALAATAAASVKAAPALQAAASSGPAAQPEHGSARNDIARLLALAMAVAGLSVTAFAFIKLRERPEPPPSLVPMPPERDPLGVNIGAPGLPASVVVADSGDAEAGPGTNPEEATDQAVSDTQVAAAPDVQTTPDTPPDVVSEPAPDVAVQPVPDVEPEPDSPEPVVAVADADDSETDTVTPAGPTDTGGPEVVEFKPTGPRERVASAIEQLLAQRGAATAPAPPEPLQAVELSAADRRALEVALATADREFVRALIEDAAALPSKVGNAEWARLRQTPGYYRTLQSLYDYVLTTNDKVRLFAAHSADAAGETPPSTPEFLRGLELPPTDLSRVRAELWDANSDNITRIVRSTL